jgi:hypothetical protein
MTRDDEPPRAAVEAMRDLLTNCGLAWPDWTEARIREASANGLRLLRALPDAELWPLVAYLAQGREPTEWTEYNLLRDLAVTMHQSGYIPVEDAAAHAAQAEKTKAAFFRWMQFADMPGERDDAKG